MFARSDPDGYILALEGIERKTLVHGAGMLMTEFRLAGGQTLPHHAHPQEQTGYLVRGKLRLSIAGQVHEVSPGDAWSIPGGVEHGAEILEDSIAIEVFSPIREDYLPDNA
jgi:unsaturated pyranuronate lyase